MILKQRLQQTFLFILIIFIFERDALFAQWRKITNGLPEEMRSGWAIDACNSTTAVISISTDKNKVFRTVDSGENWHEIYYPMDGDGVADISMVDPTHIWIGTFRGIIYASADAGITWQRQFYQPSLNGMINYIRMFDMNNGISMADCVDPISKPEGPAVFLRTTDGGQHWQSMNTTVFGGTSGDTWRRVSFVNIRVGYFFESGMNPQKIFKTVDGGQTWNDLVLPESYVTVLAFYDDQRGLAFPMHSTLYQTVDGGASWNGLSVPADCVWGQDIEFAPDDPAAVWLADHDKLYFSDDAGQSWTEQLLASCRDLVMVDRHHGFLLADNAVYYTSNGGMTHVAEQPSFSPHTAMLQQNYPNPFNSETTIPYYLAQEG
ncbi:MAG: hypothetical protein EHM72_05665, partial [Calditrichaeota bacterium]